jgi:hypothetical protein
MAADSRLINNPHPETVGDPGPGPPRVKQLVEHWVVGWAQVRGHLGDQVPAEQVPPECRTSRRVGRQQFGDDERTVGKERPVLPSCQAPVERDRSASNCLFIRGTSAARDGPELNACS